MMVELKLLQETKASMYIYTKTIYRSYFLNIYQVHEHCFATPNTPSIAISRS